MAIKSQLSLLIVVVCLLSAFTIINTADSTYQQALLQDFQSHDLNNDQMLDSSELLLMIKQMMNTDMQMQGAEEMEFSQEFYQQAIKSSLQQFDEDHNGLDVTEFRRLVESSMEDVAESLPSEDNQPEDENENEEYAL